MLIGRAPSSKTSCEKRKKENKKMEQHNHVSNESHNECFQLTLPAAGFSLWAIAAEITAPAISNGG
jgi:hypothetical protein